MKYFIFLLVAGCAHSIEDNSDELDISTHVSEKPSSRPGIDAGSGSPIEWDGCVPLVIYIDPSNPDTYPSDKVLRNSCRVIVKPFPLKILPWDPGPVERRK